MVHLKKHKLTPLLLKAALGVIVLTMLVGTVVLLSSQKPRPSEEPVLVVISEKKDFRLNEEPELQFKYRKEKSDTLTSIGETLRLADYWKDINVQADIKGPTGKTLDVQPALSFKNNGEFSVKIKKLRTFQPGVYTLAIKIEDQSGDIPQVKELEQDFTWGVLAINTNKSIYLPGDRAYLQMTVLDDKGHTVCNASLELRIKNQELRTEEVFSTKDGTIEKSTECGPKSVTYVPDYFAYYDVPDKTGIYEMHLKATRDKQQETREIYDTFEVRKSVPFDIERIGSTRIYPQATYEMRMIIKANEDFDGRVIESAPGSFDIVEANQTRINTRNNADISVNPRLDQRESASISTEGGTKLISWQVTWEAGNTYELRYQFDAPDISPYLYLLGPLELFQVSSSKFQEIRQWQIAADDFTDWKNPSSFVDGGWENEANAYSIDDSWTTTPAGTTQTSEWTNFGDFNIPTGSTIDNISVRIEAHSSPRDGGKLADLDYIELSWNAGSNYTTSGNSQNNLNPSTDVIYYFPSDPGDLWGSSWEASDFADGQFQIRITGDGLEKPSLIAYIDEIAVKVTYTYTPAGITVSGTVYSDEGSTEIGSDRALRLKVNGSGSYAATTTATSSYTFDSVTIDNPGDVVTVFLYNQATEKAVTVTRATSTSADITGLHLYQNRIIVRHEDAGPLTIADLDQYDADQDPTNILFTASTTASTALTASSTSEFLIPSGYTFSPQDTDNLSFSDADINGTFTATSTQTISVACNGGFTNASCWDVTGGTFNSASSTIKFTSTATGTITTAGTGNAFWNIEFDNSGGGRSFATGDHDVNNNFTITQGTVTSTPGTLYVGGNWTNSGTFNHGGGTVRFDDTSGGKTVDCGTLGFNVLIFDGSGGGWTLSTSTLDVNSNLSLTNGALDASSQNITLAGDLDITDGFTFTKGSGTLTFDGSETNTWIDNSAFKQDMGDVVIGGSGKTVNLNSDVEVTTLTVNTTFGAGGYTTTIGGSGTAGSRPFVVSGIFNEATSTIKFTGTATTSVESETYYNLTLDQSGTTFQLYNNATTSNNLTITNGTLDVTASNHDLWIGGNWSNSDTFTCQQGTVTFNATSSGKTITTNGSPFYTLVFNGANGVWDLQDAATTTDDITITDGTLDLNGQNLVVQGGDISVTGILAADGSSGTVSLSSAGYLGGSGTTTVYNITFLGSTTLAGDITVNNDLTISGSNSLDVSGSHHSITVSGSWSNTSGTFTARGGTVTFNAGSTGKDIDPGSSPFCDLTFNNGSGGWTISSSNATATNNFTISAGAVTSTSGILAVGGDFNNAGGTFNHNDGTLKLFATSAGHSITPGGSALNNITFNGVGGGWSFATPGSHTVSGNFTIDNGAVTSTAGTLSVGGAWSNSDIFNNNSGTITFTAPSGSHNITSGGYPFHILIFDGSGGSWALQDALDVNDAFNLTNGTTTQAASANIIWGGNVVISSGGKFIKASGSGKVVFDGTTQTYEDSSSPQQNIGDVQIGTSPGTTNLSSNMVADSLTVSNEDTFNTRGYDLDITEYITINGTLNASDTKAGNATLINLGTDWIVNSSTGNFVHATSTITFDESTASTLNSGGTTDNFDFYNLSFSKSATATTTLSSYDIKVINNLNIANSDSILDVSASNYNITVGGNWSNSGSFAAQQGTVTFIDNSVTSTFSGATTFFDFTCNTDSKVLEFTAGTSATTTISGTLTLSGQACETMIKLRSVDSPSQWYIDAQATTSINYVDIKDSYAVASTTAENSKDSGNNNENWTINGGICVSALIQLDYRWYANVDALNPITPLDATNTAITNATSGTVYRIRMNIRVTNQDLGAGEQAFTLEYATTTYLGSCTSSLDWTTVGQPSSSTAWRWRGYNNPSIADETTVTSTLLTSSDVCESYEEKNDSVVNPNAISSNQAGEWDWVVQYNVAYSTTTYCFRMVKTGGGLLDDYTNYPKVTSYGPASWKADEDINITGVSTSTDVRLRFLVANISTTTEATNYNYQIEYATRTEATCGDETFTAVPKNANGGPFELATSNFFRRESWGGDPTSHRLNDPDSYTFIAGELVEHPYATTTDITLSAEIYTEVEYMFHVTADASSTWYCFRVTNNGTVLDNYDKYAQLQVGVPAGIDITGICKQQDESTNCLNGRTIKVAVNGVLQGQTGNTSDGEWTISGVNVSSGNVVTVFIDGVGDSNEATAVTKYDGSTNIAGMKLYERHLTIGSDNQQTITNTDLEQYTNNNNEDVIHEVISTVLTVDAEGVYTDEELYILANNTLAPGGNTNTHDIEIQGTFTAAGTETHTVNGSWVNNGTFTAASSEVKFTSTSIGEAIITNSQHFYKLTFDGSGGGWSFATGTDHYVDNNFKISNGTVTSTASTTYVGGSWSNSGTFNHSSGTVTFDAGDSGHTISDGGDPFYNITFNNGSGGWTYQDGSSIAPNQTTVTAGTATYINAKTGTVSVAAGGTLYVDWYLGVHAVWTDATSTDVNNGTTTISEHSTTSQATIWRHNGSVWGTPSTTQITQTNASGTIPQPGSDGAIRIREYEKEGATYTFYKYNLEITADGFNNYDYYLNQGTNYITSTSSPEEEDTCISEQWHRSNITNNNPEPDLNYPPDYGTWYIGMGSDLEFSVSSTSTSLILDDPNFTDTASTTLYATTSYSGGYTIKAYANHDGRLRLDDSNYIIRWDHPNSTPAVWTSRCIDESQWCGFGHTTDDDNLEGEGENDRFASNKYAGFATSFPGDIVADATSSVPTGAQHIITYKASVSKTRVAGEYETTVWYICTVNY